MEEYLKRTSLLETPCFHYGRDDRVRLCHEKMFEAYQLPKNRDLMMNSILYEYLYLLASKFPRTYIPAHEKKITYVEEALRYIENNYAHSVNIQVIADSLNIERTYLYRLFKDITGTSPQEYLLDYRIRRACTLLKETSLPVSDIARSVGYDDALYFSRLFKQRKKKTPTQYRRDAAEPNQKGGIG